MTCTRPRGTVTRCQSRGTRALRMGSGPLRQCWPAGLARRALAAPPHQVADLLHKVPPLAPERQDEGELPLPGPARDGRGGRALCPPAPSAGGVYFVVFPAGGHREFADDLEPLGELLLGHLLGLEV